MRRTRKKFAKKSPKCMGTTFFRIAYIFCENIFLLHTELAMNCCRQLSQNPLEAAVQWKFATAAFLGLPRNNVALFCTTCEEEYWWSFPQRAFLLLSDDTSEGYHFFGCACETALSRTECTMVLQGTYRARQGRTSDTRRIKVEPTKEETT